MLTFAQPKKKHMAKAEWKIIHIDETDSTNRWLKDRLATASVMTDEDHLVIMTEYQTAGRGCGTNTWESERGKNLTFSVLIRPQDMPASHQFHISMAMSLAICEALGTIVGDLSIKWPNDIYWRDSKIAGMLIEHTLVGTCIKDSIIGVGLNVNQRIFHSDAPNPASLWQIRGHETNRSQLLHSILDAFERYLLQDNIREKYLIQLYRRRGFYPYCDKNGAFMARIITVKPDGQLLLCDEENHERCYFFKEVRFI
jgi:BirA family biotin operon repressor/biotin-[acetyl-CoA-carboxylase] ligase